NAYSAGSVKKAAPWTPLWRPTSPNTTARSAAIFTTRRTCCWPSAIATSQRSRVVVPKTPLTVDAGPDNHDFFYSPVLPVGIGAGRGGSACHHRHQPRHRRAAPDIGVFQRLHDLD